MDVFPSVSVVQKVVRFVRSLALAAAMPAVLVAQTGRISGRVTDAASGKPLAGARVSIVGTTLLTGTSNDGQYVFNNVPAGARDVRVASIGFAVQRKSVTLTAGQSLTVDFGLVVAATALEQVVVTATGEQAKKELGNAVTQIAVAQRVETKPIANMSDLLNSQAPGVQVLASPLTGGGQRIRIRGTNSLSLNNEPIFVIDGVRMTSDNNAASIGIGGTNPSRLNDINPNDIESMEIVKGPSAATLYGTDAANGVIVIRTKQGRPGRATWNAFIEQGAIKDYNHYPIAWRSWRTTPTASTATNTVQCFLFQVAAGTCTQDSVTSFNLFKDKDATPNGTGRRQQYGLSLGGGVGNTRYYLSGDWEDEVGQLTMPQFAVDSIRARRNGEDPLPEQLRPNGLRKVNVRANLSASPTSKLDLSASTGFVTLNQRLPQTDNNTTGLLSNAFGGLNKNNGIFGYRAFTPDGFFSETVTQGINRFIGSGTANYRPSTWLTGRLTGGIDYTSRNESDLCRRGQCVAFSTYPTGFKTNNRTEYFNYTADAGATATSKLTPAVQSRASAGLQWVKKVFARNGAYGENLAPGATQAGAGSIQQVSELKDESKTLGAYVEEQIGVNDRLFITGAVRNDNNSAFGKNFKSVFYPKGSISWVISDESFFPRPDFLRSLRLRAAIGSSGTSPGPTDALRFYSATTANLDNADVPAVVYSALGNPDLKPERATEAEAGFDLNALTDRLTIEMTYYSKVTKDALVLVPIAPSVGAATSRFMNIGSVKNAGIEFGINSRLLDWDRLGIDFGVSGSTNHNKLVTLGVDANGKDIPPIIGATRQQRPGYPLDGLWSPAITSYNDANANGIIELSEITVTDTAVYIGPDKPVIEMSFNTGVDLLKRKLRISALIDHKGGHYLLNGTERIRCQSRNNCRGLIDKTASLEEQARTVAVRLHPTQTQGGYMEKADFTRLRELSATYTMPEKIAGLLRANTASVTAAGRNLRLWTGYSGLDPESGYFSGALGTVSDFQTAPPPTYFTFRLNLTF